MRRQQIFAFLHFLAIGLKPFHITYFTFRTSVSNVVLYGETKAATEWISTKSTKYTCADLLAATQTVVKTSLLSKVATPDIISGTKYSFSSGTAVSVHLTGLFFIYLGPIVLTIMYVAKSFREKKWPEYRTPKYVLMNMELFGSLWARLWSAVVLGVVVLLAVVGVTQTSSGAFPIVAVAIIATLQNMVTLLDYSTEGASWKKTSKIGTTDGGNPTQSLYSIIEDQEKTFKWKKPLQWYKGYDFMDSAYVTAQKISHETRA